MKRKQSNGLDVLLALWIGSDTLLRRDLEDGHLKLLYHRLVKKYSFERISKENQLSVGQLKALFEAIMCIIERSHGYILADFLREIDLSIESKKRSSKRNQSGFNTYRIWLN